MISHSKRAISILLSTITLIVNLGFGFDTYAQDGSPDLYLPLEGEIEEEPALEEESYIYEDQYFGEEDQYYEDVIEEDTSSVSMLTFNFLFYIVYKLKFSDGDSKEETVKTADDD